MKTSLRSRLVLGAAAAIVVLGAAAYACKGFLDTPAQGTLDVNALTSKIGVEGALIATYRSLDCNNATNGNWGCAASNWPFGSITSDEAYKGSEATDQPQATDIELYAWSSDKAQDYLDRKWASMYEGISRANATLRLLAKVSAAKPGEISRTDSAGIAGEAIFLRAHFHFELWRMWGNVPYYVETDTLDFRKANDPSPPAGTTAVGNQIIADLNTAIGLLPATPRNGQAGRVTKGTARAYKGRVFIYMHQYAAAVAVFDSVIASGQYALESSFDKVWSGFKANWGKETILAFNASVNDGEPNGNNANYGERLNLPHSGSPFKCCGFHQPSQNMANAFAVDAVTGLPKAFTSPTTWNNRDVVWKASIADTVDPRMDWTIGRDSVPYKDWGMHLPSWIRAPGYGGPYSPKKNAQEKASGAVSKVGWQPEQENGVHIHIFRYADLLLLDAEAKVETNDLAGALTLVNQVRARAAVTAQGCGDGSTDAALVVKYPGCAGNDKMAVPLNDPSIQWATYKVSPYPAFADQATARLAVQIERRLELGMEGQRLFDLHRYGTAVATQVMTDYLTIEKGALRRAYKAAQLPYASKNDFYPIPQVEIDLSKLAGQPSTLTQNTGW